MNKDQLLDVIAGRFEKMITDISDSIENAEDHDPRAILTMVSDHMETHLQALWDEVLPGSDVAPPPVEGELMPSKEAQDWLDSLFYTSFP